MRGFTALQGSSIQMQDKFGNLCSTLSTVKLQNL